MVFWLIGFQLITCWCHCQVELVHRFYSLSFLNLWTYSLIQILYWNSNFVLWFFTLNRVNNASQISCHAKTIYKRGGCWFLSLKYRLGCLHYELTQGKKGVCRAEHSRIIAGPLLVLSMLCICASAWMEKPYKCSLFDQCFIRNSFSFWWVSKICNSYIN